MSQITKSSKIITAFNKLSPPVKTLIITYGIALLWTYITYKRSVDYTEGLGFWGKDHLVYDAHWGTVSNFLWGLPTFVILIWGLIRFYNHPYEPLPTQTKKWFMEHMSTQKSILVFVPLLIIAATIFGYYLV